MVSIFRECCFAIVYLFFILCSLSFCYLFVGRAKEFISLKKKMRERRGRKKRGFISFFFFFFFLSFSLHSLESSSVSIPNLSLVDNLLGRGGERDPRFCLELS